VNENSHSTGFEKREIEVCDAAALPPIDPRAAIPSIEHREARRVSFDRRTRGETVINMRAWKAWLTACLQSGFAAGP
jgi:hypothetical protein